MAMVRSKGMWCAALCLAILAGCEDDSKKSVDVTPEPGQSECVAANCKTGICLDNGECKPECVPANCDSGECLDNGDCKPKCVPANCESGECLENGDCKPKCVASECESGECLDNGECKPKDEDIEGLGDACDDVTPCKNGLECMDGTCQKNEVTEVECSDSKPCGDGMECENNECKTIVYLKHKDACNPSSKVSVCDENLKCWYELCLTAQEIENYGKCTGPEDCAGETEYTDCLESGVCGKKVALGEACDGKKLVCDGEDVRCDFFCTKVAQKDEPCDEMEFITCNSRLRQYCIDGYCRQYETNLPLGRECHEGYALCGQSLHCIDEICSEVHGESESCDTAGHVLCASGLFCDPTDSTCKRVGAEGCASTDDCKEMDSYCCLDEKLCGAEQVGKCVPYNDTVNHDEACLYHTKPGIFEAQVQCRWQPPSDAYPSSKNVEMPPLIGSFGNKKGLKTVVAVYSYGGSTHLRIIDPNTCETLETITESISGRWQNYPSAADLDGDGLMEIITGTSTKTYIFKWNEQEQKHKKVSSYDSNWRAMRVVADIDNDGNPDLVGVTGSVLRVNKSDLKMTELNPGQSLFTEVNKSDTYVTESGQDVAVVFLDNDNIAELITGKNLSTWNVETKKWEVLLTFDWHNENVDAWVRQFTAYADFGTWNYDPSDANKGTFDFTVLDGMPEIVISGKSKMSVYAVRKGDGNIWEKKQIMSVDGFTRGGPITIGDFNNDGLPEIGIASNAKFGVYDPKCTEYVEGKCAGKNVLWERWSQDGSSGTTGSSLFDFDGDGQAEAVYADECFIRIYDGKNGRILFSSKRSSTTSIEAPVVADIDDDGSAEILMGSDTNYSCYNDGDLKINKSDKIDPTSSSATYEHCVDPMHEGIRCIDDEDCPTGTGCMKTLGLCECHTDDDCNTQTAPGKTTIVHQYVCTKPIHPDVGFYRASGTSTQRTPVKGRGVRPDGWKEGDYKVCRATRKTTDMGVGDLMIYRDRLDRWVSSRNIWNQHAYNIINIEDNGQISTPVQWHKSWMANVMGKFIDGTTHPRRKYNNYRLNSQGAIGAGRVADITGSFVPNSICGETEDGSHVISGKMCNRGTRQAAKETKAAFFFYDEEKEDKRGNVICETESASNLEIGQCKQVGCVVPEDIFEQLPGKKVIFITNYCGVSACTAECNPNNNNDTIEIQECKTEKPIEIVN